MEGRRLEHPEQRKFFEVYWEGSTVEVTAGAIGNAGRTRDYQFATPAERDEFITAEITKRLKRGFLEHVPEIVRARDVAHVAPDERFLADIAASFDDDAPRLVYADHLQTQNDPLGELISVQCELARLPAWDVQYPVLADRAETLLRTYHKRWMPKQSDAKWTFVRGFVETVELDMTLRADAISDLFARTPLMRTVVLEHARAGFAFDATSRLPWSIIPPAVAKQLTGLHVHGFHLNGSNDYFRTSPVQLLVDDPAFANVTRLALRSCSLTAADVAPLGTRAWRSLDLYNNVLGARGTTSALARPEQLESLDLGRARIREAGALVLAKVPFRTLRSLSLRASAVTPAALRALARAPHLATLERLVLAEVLGVSALFHDAELPALAELDLSRTELDAAGFTALLASPLARTLRVLDVSSNHIDDARLLLEAELPQLRVLDISSNPLGDRMRELKSGLPHVRITARNTIR